MPSSIFHEKAPWRISEGILSLLDMKEEGRTGAVAMVTANGTLTLQGFSGLAVSSLNIRVNSYAALKSIRRNDYGG